MIVEVKSRNESTREAKTDNEEDVNVTIILAISSSTFAIKLTNIATFTILEDELISGEAPCIGRSGLSSSKETLREGG